MCKILLFFIIVIIWVGLWGLITLLINEVLIKYITDIDPLLLRSIAYILIILIFLLIICATNNVESLV